MLQPAIFKRSLPRLVHDDEGAQIIEYALIIAVVSIALVLALQGVAGGKFADFITRVSTCLTGSCT